MIWLVPVHGSQEVGGFFIPDKFSDLIAQGPFLLRQQGVVEHGNPLSTLSAQKVLKKG
jgi:hypothetical protein